jgi:hypothetical protein
VAGQVERRREPPAGGHIELPAAALRERRDGLDGALERPGVERPPVPNAAEVRKVVGRRAQPRRGAQRRERRRQEPEEHAPAAAAPAGAAAPQGYRGALPQEHQREPDDPRGGQQRLFGCDEGCRAPALVEPPGARLHHRAAVPVPGCRGAPLPEISRPRARRLSSVGGAGRGGLGFREGGRRKMGKVREGENFRHGRMRRFIRWKSRLSEADASRTSGGWGGCGWRSALCRCPLKMARIKGKLAAAHHSIVAFVTGY